MLMANGERFNDGTEVGLEDGNTLGIDDTLGFSDGRRDSSFDGPREGFRDRPREGSADGPEERVRDGLKENFTDGPREGSVDVNMQVPFLLPFQIPSFMFSHKHRLLFHLVVDLPSQHASVSHGVFGEVGDWVGDGVGAWVAANRHIPLPPPIHAPPMTSSHLHRFLSPALLNRRRQHFFVSQVGFAVGPFVGASPGPAPPHEPLLPPPLHTLPSTSSHLHLFLNHGAPNLIKQHWAVSHEPDVGAGDGAERHNILFSAEVLRLQQASVVQMHLIESQSQTIDPAVGASILLQHLFLLIPKSFLQHRGLSVPHDIPELASAPSSANPNKLSLGREISVSSTVAPAAPRRRMTKSDKKRRGAVALPLRSRLRRGNRPFTPVIAAAGVAANRCAPGSHPFPRALERRSFESIVVMD